MKHQAETTVQLEAQKRCRLLGRRFKPGDTIAVRLGESFDEQGEGFGAGGPWGPGGYTSRYVRRIADQISFGGEAIYVRTFWTPPTTPTPAEPTDG